MARISSRAPVERASLVLRLGLAFIFGYAAISSLLQPLDWTGYLPQFISSIVNAVLAVRGIAVYELLLAIWLVSGRYQKYAAALATLTLAGITLANINLFVITFRDVGLLCAAAALFLLSTN